jgi:hypothetical protein
MRPAPEAKSAKAAKLWHPAFLPAALADLLAVPANPLKTSQLAQHAQGAAAAEGSILWRPCALAGHPAD